MASTPPSLVAPDSTRFFLSIASAGDREQIAGLRHDIYARELGQHSANSSGTLRDALDDDNVVLVARCSKNIAGFISITPPG